MIGRLQGVIVDKTHPGKFVIDVNGVGYDVETSLQTFFNLESCTETIIIHNHTIVREDAFILYGFDSVQERELFRALIKVNGVGPKLAIGILSSITPNHFIQTLANKDISGLNQIPGIGKKTAERLLIELKDLPDKIGTQFSGNERLHSAATNGAAEAISALILLGYKATEVNKAMKQIDNGEKSCEQLIRDGLKWLSSTL